MCTATVCQKRRSLLVTINRDELRGRAPELPPEVLPSLAPGRPRWMAPLDGDRQGTWVGANSLGVVAFLLNGYLDGCPPETGQQETAPSRGEIIPRLLAKGTLDDCLEWLYGGFDPAGFLSFLLFVVTPNSLEPVFWNGRGELRRVPQDQFVSRASWAMVTSSSWNTRAVLDWRREQFLRWVDSGSSLVRQLPAFHLLKPEGKESWAPLMSREESATRSITQVEAKADHAAIEMRYWPSPFARFLGPPQRLRLDPNGTS